MKDLDWSNLSFGYRQTDYNVRCYYRSASLLTSGDVIVTRFAEGTVKSKVE